MDFGSVLYESMDRVATITLNRPERLNAISETMPDNIASAFKQAVSERDSGDPIPGSKTSTGKGQLKARQNCWGEH